MRMNDWKEESFHILLWFVDADKRSKFNKAHTHTDRDRQTDIDKDKTRETSELWASWEMIVFGFQTRSSTMFVMVLMAITKRIKSIIQHDWWWERTSLALSYCGFVANDSAQWRNRTMQITRWKNKKKKNLTRTGTNQKMVLEMVMGKRITRKRISFKIFVEWNNKKIMRKREKKNFKLIVWKWMDMEDWGLIVIDRMMDGFKQFFFVWWNVNHLNRLLLSSSSSSSLSRRVCQWSLEKFDDDSSQDRSKWIKMGWKKNGKRHHNNNNKNVTNQRQFNDWWWHLTLSWF